VVLYIHELIFCSFEYMYSGVCFLLTNIILWFFWCLEKDCWGGGGTLKTY